MAKSDNGAPAPAQAPVGRSVQRSPNFPALSLDEALKRVQTIYDKDKRNPISGAVILEHLGYGKKMSGSAGRVLSAMRQYGLLDDAADDKYRVSDAAYLILSLPQESIKRWEAIGKCATKPATFKAVLGNYPSELPSDSTLREYLIAERGFNPASVETFIRALKATITFGKLYETSYNGADEQGADDVEEQVHGTGEPVKRNSSTPSPSPQTVIARDVYTLAEGEVVIQWPATMSRESVADLDDWLALVVKKLKRRYAE